MKDVETDPRERPIDNPAFRYFLEEAALWRRAHLPASNVVDAAVQALLEGTESVSFILIAGLGRAEADRELGELLPAALDELGLDCLGYDDPNNDVLAAAAMSRRFLSGELEAKQLTQAIHRRFGHICDPLVEQLSILDDHFDALDDSTASTRGQLVAETHTAATNLQDKADEIYGKAPS